MLKNQIKDRINEELKKAEEAGKVTTDSVYKILESAVSNVLSESKDGVAQLRPVVKDAVGAAMTGLKEIGADTKETVEGAVKGAIAGARSHGDQVVEATREEIQQLETRLAKEKAQLAENLTKGLEGARDAGETLSGDAKKWLESAIVDIKLKSTQLLGLTRQTVKEAVNQTKKTTSVLRQKARNAAGKTADKVTDKLKEAGKETAKATTKAASALADETRELGKKSVDVAKGAISGMWKGATDALKKEKENK